MLPTMDLDALRLRLQQAEADCARWATQAPSQQLLEAQFVSAALRLRIRHRLHAAGRLQAAAPSSAAQAGHAHAFRPGPVDGSGDGAHCACAIEQTARCACHTTHTNPITEGHPR